MPQEIISTKTKANLEILTRERLLKNFYLAGGTGIKVADLRDIGCMKIDAISSRGTKRDFIDLFFICKEVISLKNLLSLFKRKYKSVNYNMMHILKSLAYFEDAENNPMPKMTVPASWQEIKSFLKKEIKKINDK
ncbi:MAG: nucleotidyl transferase AbiEii/AbiGii toxin family protein [Candidatus Atribacteria bacterium]|nr:nucleotidyl transferase AbiEii/AbiGii toxin family protein [Candidatus Atribacteria bacterium]